MPVNGRHPRGDWSRNDPATPFVVDRDRLCGFWTIAATSVPGASVVTRTFWVPVLAFVLLGASGLASMQPTAAQQTVNDCTAFASFAEANAYYTAHPDAANALDDDGDGTACEGYFGHETRDVDGEDGKSG